MVAGKVMCTFAAVAVALAVGQEFEQLSSLRATLTNDVQLGIDLGTTLSVAALCIKGDVSVVEVDGAATTPSTVWFSKSRGIAVGREAVAARSQEPENVIYAAKRVMGLDYEDPDKHQHLAGLPFDFAPVSESGPWAGNVGFRLPGRRVVAPEQVGALVLKKLKKAAEESTLLDWLRRNLGFSFKSVTVSIPVTFGAEQKKATIRAAKMAGFREVRLIEEPIAAAIAYGLGRERETKRVLVFDIGGGTLDVALLFFNSYSGNFYVETTAGEPKLGGEDFDIIVADLALAGAPAALAAAVRASPGAYQNLLVAAEAAKRGLSRESSVEVCIPHADGGTARCAERVEVTREQFREAAQPKFLQGTRAIQRVLDDAGLDASVDLDVVLVGGSSRIPAIREDIAAMLPKATIYADGVDPDQAVAVGAAKSWGCNHAGP